MNAPPLIRPLRSVLQGRLFASRSTPILFRPSTQMRTNSSLIDNYDDYDAVLEGALKASAEKMAAAAEPEPTDVAAQVVQPAPKKAESSKKAEGSKKAKGSKISIGQHVPEGKLNPSYHGPRMPRSLELLYLEPLRREAEFGVPSCDLQLRSYSVPNLEFFCDFALRAAYYLKLPAYGPIPLPRLTKRWTVPRSVFVHKKSQENFERITLRRLIQIRDGNPESVQLWLAFLQKHAYFGVGMKANVWEFSGLDVAAKMDESAKELNEVLKDKWQLLGQHKSQKLDEKFKTLEAVQEFLAEQRVLAINGPAASTPTTPSHETDTPQPPKVIFSGIQPTGIPHLGNYLGALQQWKRMQDEASPDTRLIFCIVDLHAITVRRDRGLLAQYKKEMLAAILAVGIDPERSTIFYQSSVPAHSELQWILSCTASMGYLSRMTQWKSKMSMAEDQELMDKKVLRKLKHGLFSYPILQAADILVHRATHVPVGKDQSQHLEFARECVTNFNAAYGGKHLVYPETILSPQKRVMSLRDPHKKMSKSDPDPSSRILLTDTPSETTTKINRAITDTIPHISYDPDSRPGVSNLLSLLSHFADASQTPQDVVDMINSFDEVTSASEGTRNAAAMKYLKGKLAGRINDELGGVRERYAAIMGRTERDGGEYLREVVEFGGKKARESAEGTMEIVRAAVELGI
ncbi:mitochondrial tryptophan--tRNA ligase [Rhypophila decipiens]|uniref:Small ribosomal subunit protein uS10m n=1 Tax=Rhypophila decipiens TaxID=261697 RepID=A0AAN7BB70_9PEZI|nr:mitochondrial tryptophan--tRNA ligase [Rhypophila decipiens]